MDSIKGNNKYLLVLLALFTFVTFFPVLRNQFINFDDNKFIYDNELIRGDRVDFSAISKEQIFTPNYKPLVYTLWAFEYKLFKDNPAGYHLINLTLHILNTALVFLIISLLIRKFFKFKNAAWTAFFPAIIFALHPLKTESVAWASELKDMLFAFCYFSSLMFYLYFLNEKRPVFLVFSVISFLFGIFSKSMIISLPFILLLTDYLYGRSLKENYLAEKAPFFIILCFGLYLYGVPVFYVFLLAAILVGFAYFLKQDFITRFKHSKFIFIIVAGSAILLMIGLWLASYAGLDTVTLRNKADFALSDTPVINFFITASTRVYLWVIKLLYPFRLALVYRIPDYLDGRQLALYTLLIPSSAIVILALLIWFFKRNRFVLFIIAYFLISIFPAIISAPAGTNFLPDRYTYISSLSYCLIFVLLINKATKPVFLYLIISIYIICLAIRANIYSRDWKNSISVWTASLRGSESWQAYFNRSQAYFALKDYENSYADINRSLKIDSTSSDSYFNRGLCLIPLRKYNDAIRDFDKALRLNPANNKAISYKAMCYFYLENYAQAINFCNQVLKNEPRNIKTYLTRAIAKEKLKDYNGAIDDFTTMITLEPQNGENFYRRGISKLLNRDTTGSCQDWKISRNMNFAKASEMITRYCK